MFAVIKTGGKQYKVAGGDELSVERLDAAPGEQVQFNDVLMLGGGETEVTLGAPLVAGAAVQAEVLEQERGPKVISFKKRRRKHSSQRKRGHRQHLTRVRVTDILASGAEATGIKTAIGTGKTGGLTSMPTASVPEPTAPEPIAPEPTAPEDLAVQNAPMPGDVAPDTPMAEEGVRPANLLDAAEGEADDLTRISGVGPGLNAKLNDLGVFHFHQIAAWGADEIAWMDDKLSFKGRIERDEWIAQAAALAADAQ
ncbi:MAG: 50S ribosomal protein L21 [Pseudomonadota bacterium]